MQKAFFIVITFLFGLQLVNAQQNYEVVSYGQCETAILDKALLKSNFARFQQENKIMQMNIDCGAKVNIYPSNVTEHNNLPIVTLRNNFVLHETGFLGEKVSRISKEEN